MMPPGPNMNHDTHNQTAKNLTESQLFSVGFKIAKLKNKEAHDPVCDAFYLAHPQDPSLSLSSSPGKKFHTSGGKTRPET